MDVIFTNERYEDQGVLSISNGDFAFGQDENTFQIDLMRGSAVPVVGSAVYIDQTDTGGLVTGYKSSADSRTLTLVGDTWNGVLNRHILQPLPGQAYYYVSGDVKDVVAQIVNAIGFGSFFHVLGGQVGVNITHTFTSSDGTQDDQDSARFVGGWDAIWRILLLSGCKVIPRWNAVSKVVELSVSRAWSWTDEESLSAGIAKIGITTDKPANHVICLGDGEKENRQIYHAFADVNGYASGTQTIFGVDEITEVDDFSNKSGQELVDAGLNKVRELQGKAQQVDIKTLDNDTAKRIDLGDTVGGVDERTGIQASAVVTKKVVNVNNNLSTVQFTTTVK